MTSEPAPLTDEDLAAIRDGHHYSTMYGRSIVLRLIATVDRLKREAEERQAWTKTLTIERDELLEARLAHGEKHNHFIPADEPPYRPIDRADYERLKAKAAADTRIAVLEAERNQAHSEIAQMWTNLAVGTLHVPHCNGDRSVRVGAAGSTCNCTLGREILSLRAARETAEAERDQLRAELDRTAKERDRAWVKGAQQHEEKTQILVDAAADQFMAIRRTEAAEAALAEAQELLRPFAFLGNSVAADDRPRDDEAAISHQHGVVTFGEFRRVRALLSRAPAGGPVEAGSQPLALQTPEEFARSVVVNWLEDFEPPPEITFQQSEGLQRCISAAIHAAREQAQQEPAPADTGGPAPPEEPR